MNLFSQFLEFGGRGHVTWEFKPGSCSLPEGILENMKVTIMVIGKYHDDDIDADIVQVVLPSGDVLKEQPNKNKTVLHITRETRNGVKPVQSGIRATKFGWVPVTPYSIRAKACFYKGGK